MDERAAAATPGKPTKSGAEIWQTPLISTHDLSNLIKKKEIPMRMWLMDCSFLERVGRDSHAEFALLRIKGAAFFDLKPLTGKMTDVDALQSVLEDMASTALPLLPPASNSIRVEPSKDFFVVYDSMGVSSSALAWWILKAAGFPHVAVLDGGLPKWVAESLPVETSAPQPVTAAPVDTMPTVPNGRMFSNLADVTAIADIARLREEHSSQPHQPAVRLIDSRPAALAEHSGRIPTSTSLPAALLVEGSVEYSRPKNTIVPFEPSEESTVKPLRPLSLIDDGQGNYLMTYTKMKPANVIEKTVRDIMKDRQGRGAGIPPPLFGASRVVTYCVSGVNASVLNFTLYIAGKPLSEMSLFAGGFPQWQQEGRSIEGGPPVQTNGHRTAPCNIMEATSWKQVAATVVLAAITVAVVWRVGSRLRR